MTWYDWLIVAVPVFFVLYTGGYSRRYLKDVTAFLSAGRVCGRYVISVGDLANGLSIIGLLAYVEVHCRTGFALGFWSQIIMPISVLLSLYGYCMYRFRETKAQSIGQFFEMRYSRKLRVFAASLRSLSEMLASMIMPALAARFFMYFLNLPKEFTFLGMTWNTFNTIMFVVLVAAISIICMGGSLAIIVTDTIQGFICYPLLVLFIVFILCKFSWSKEILPVMSSRVAGENFLSPYDIHNLRDFNLFALFVTVFGIFMHRASWTGAGGSTCAAKSAHEQKMASLLGDLRYSINSLFYILMAVALLTFMNHFHFAAQAHKIRLTITEQIANDIVKDAATRKNVVDGINKMPVQTFHPGADKALSEKDNVDTKYLNQIHSSLLENSKDKGKSNSLFQQFRTLYNQQLLSVTMRSMLPSGMLGLFCLLMVLAMISTDDSRIFSATITISQDVILPFIKKPLNPRQHMWMLRAVAIGIGVFFFLGSKYMAQMDYINLYVTLVCSMWLGGCGPVIVFGLYSRFGTTLGAWASLLNGMFMAVGGVFVQRKWADLIYPWLVQNDLVDSVGNVLETISKPFNPIIVWKMNEIKCPINSYEWYFITMIVSLGLYFLFSALSRPEQPFNLERMLHRGKYALDGQQPVTASTWTRKDLFNKFIGINSEYTFWDKVIAWSYFSYSIIYGFFGSFIVVIVWNLFYPWPTAWWGVYFLITFMIVPGILAAITAVWVTICGTIDLRTMFRDLNKRIANPLDNGQVEGNMSLADKAELEAVDKKPDQEKRN